MKNSKKIIFSTFFLIIILIIFFAYIHFNVMSIYGNKIRKIKIKNEVFRIEVVDTIKKKEKGLGGRKSICNNCGMMFVFFDSKYHYFWMKDMQFPLDIVWLKDGKVVGIEKNIPHDSYEILHPNVHFDLVIEFPANKMEEIDLKVGDEISI